MDGRKTAVTLLALCLAGGVIAAPAGAKKTKRKPVQADQTYYLVNANEGSGCADSGLILKLTPSSTNFSQCIGLGSGLANDATVAAFGTPCPGAIVTGVERCATSVFRATEGLPLTLDATRAIRGTIHASSMDVGGGLPPLGAGPATLHGAVTATVAGDEKVLGTFTAEYLVGSAQKTYEVPFEVAPDAALGEAELTTFALELWSGGVPAQVYEMNLSNVIVPTWRRR